MPEIFNPNSGFFISGTNLDSTDRIKWGDVTIGLDRRINDHVTFKTSVRLPSRFHRDPNNSVLAKETAIIAALTYRY